MNKNFFQKLSVFTVSILTVLSLMAFLPVNKIYAAENTDNTNQIKGVVTNYFNSEYESIEKGQAVNVDSIIGNEKLKEFINLKNSREGIWFKKLNYNLVNYSININYNSINFNGDICTVDISNDTQFSFDQDPNIVSKEFGAKHVITLKKTTNKWLIDSDLDESEASEADRSVNNSIKRSAVSDDTTDLDKKVFNLKEKVKNIDKEVNDYKEFQKNSIKTREMKVATRSSLKSFEGRTWDVDYNRMAAVAYAHKWAMSYNKSYRSYSADCANFVSQAIFAGAPVKNYIWQNSIKGGSPAWVNLNNQWTFLITNISKGPVATNSTRKLGSDYGDVLNFWSTSENMYYHDVIITKIGDTGNLFYSGHTAPRSDYALAMAYATGQYTQSKERTAHIWGYNR